MLGVRAGRVCGCVFGAGMGMGMGMDGHCEGSACEYVGECVAREVVLPDWTAECGCGWLWMAMGMHGDGGGYGEGLAPVRL